MTLLLEIARTPDQVLALDTHELGWAVLDFIRREQHPTSGNVFTALVHLYDEPLSNKPGVGRDVWTERELRVALAEAIGWLVGNGLVVVDYDGMYSYHRPSRRGRELNTEDAFQRFLRATVLRPEGLHDQIRDAAWSNYVRGEFGTAIFAAFKQVEVAVRSAAELDDTDIGVDLMRKAFHHVNGQLTDMSLPKSEREAIAHLFAGAIGAFKNPNSHREVGLNDAAKAAEALMLASHLMRIVREGS